MTSRQLCSFFYSDLGEGLFQCKTCGCKRKQASGSGYSNLLGHIGAKHAGYASEYAELQAATTTPTVDMFGFVDEITLNIYQWMRWIIQRNLPITAVENKLTREVVTMTRTTVRTMKTYMRFTAAKVGRG
ncbi:hypothetical protein F441_15883 [Phytophthora nicotianae CJ01A1]|uniref:BED-type domain-containing protein n=1 Tax=Phytophthora nicotianae CJ01A1 TaxID=1317063 RepID=W2WC55_PHYNI|nr:hypothetical protein F441_15883 [Phytophthora nicotianae CJ01A1]